MHYSKTWVTVEGDSISRNAELTRLEQVRPSSANKRPKGHLHTALGPGANTHMWEQSIFSQGLSVPVWSNGWMICKPSRKQEGVLIMLFFAPYNQCGVVVLFF